MNDDAIEQWDAPDFLEKRDQEARVDAFAIADYIHKEFRSTENWNKPCLADLGVEIGSDDGNNVEDEDNANFDLFAVEDVVHELYTRAKSSKLAATIFLLNLCTVYGVSNCFGHKFLFYLTQPLTT